MADPCRLAESNGEEVVLSTEGEDSTERADSDSNDII